MKDLTEIKDAVRKGYSFPGGYPLHLIIQDSEALCVKCARKEWKLVSRATKYPLYADKQWGVVGVAINWEDYELVCSHCYKKIESAYGANQ